jgi:hypothetical protein
MTSYKQPVKLRQDSSRAHPQGPQAMFLTVSMQMGQFATASRSSGMGGGIATNLGTAATEEVCLPEDMAALDPDGCDGRPNTTASLFLAGESVSRVRSTISGTSFKSKSTTCWRQYRRKLEKHEEAIQCTHNRFLKSASESQLSHSISTQNGGKKSLTQACAGEKRWAAPVGGLTVLQHFFLSRWMPIQFLPTNICGENHNSLTFSFNPPPPNF